MGSCKDNVTPKNKKKGEGKTHYPGVKTVKAKESLMERAARSIGVRRKQITENKPEKFVDCLELADDKLTDMITTKTHDLEHESGEESDNRLKLAQLESMAFHLDKIAELCQEYQDV